MGLKIILKNAEFPHNEYRLKGRIYRPYKEGRHPAVVICHGYPGDTKNMDLAEEIAFNGYVVLIFYYQGAWGSQGDYSLQYLAPSTRSALKYLKSLEYVDTDKVGLISHSMGAVALTNTMKEDRSLKTGILMSPASDFSSWNEEARLETMIQGLMFLAAGKLTNLTEDSIKTDLQVVAESLNPVDEVKKVNAPLMVVVGSNDTVTKPSDCKKVYENANEPKEWVEIPGADHSFTEHRIPLQKTVIRWLENHLK